MFIYIFICAIQANLMINPAALLPGASPTLPAAAGVPPSTEDRPSFKVPVSSPIATPVAAQANAGEGVSFDSPAQITTLQSTHKVRFWFWLVPPPIHPPPHTHTQSPKWFSTATISSGWWVTKPLSCRLVPKSPHSEGPRPEQRGSRQPKDPGRMNTWVKAVMFWSPARVSPAQPCLHRARTARETAVQHPRPQRNPQPQCRLRLLLKPPPDLSYWRCQSPKGTPAKKRAVANCCHLLMSMTFLPLTACLVSPRPRARPRAPPPPDGHPNLPSLKRPVIRAPVGTTAACRPFSTTTRTIFSRGQSRRRRKVRNTQPFWMKMMRMRTFLDLALAQPTRQQAVKKLVVASPSRTSSRYLTYFWYIPYFIAFSVSYFFHPLSRTE